MAPAGHRGIRLVVAASFGMVVAGCGGGMSPDSVQDTTSVVTSTPSSPPTPSLVPSPADKAKQDALAAYRGMWQDFVAAGATSDWQSPTLGRYATGGALTNLSRSLYADHYNGLVTKGEPILNPSVSSVDPEEAPTKVVVTDCGDSTQWLKYRADNGQPANDTPGGRSLINAIVQKQSDGSWKVSDYGVHEAGSC